MNSINTLDHVFYSCEDAISDLIMQQLLNIARVRCRSIKRG